MNGAEAKIIAYISATDPKPGIIEMKRFCAQQLPVYMNPDLFVFMDALPRTKRVHPEGRRKAELLRRGVGSRGKRYNVPVRCQEYSHGSRAELLLQHVVDEPELVLVIVG